MFSVWMHTNKHNPATKQLIYTKFPSSWVWNRDKKKWFIRQKGISIGRIFYVHPYSGESFYLRMLLNIMRGPKNHEDIKNVNSC